MSPKKRKFLYQSDQAKSVANKYRIDPFEINFLPEFQQNRGPRDAFVNEYGVVIGDHDYESENSPLENWNKDTDPAIMAGDQWVHPYKDVGFHSSENRQYFESNIPPQQDMPGKMFMHPTINVTPNDSTVDMNDPSEELGQQQNEAQQSDESQSMINSAVSLEQQEQWKMETAEEQEALEVYEQMEKKALTDEHVESADEGNWS